MKEFPVRSLLIAVSLTLAVCATLAFTQDEVAEGEYQAQAATPSSTPLVKTATRWVLYGNTSGGYRLESEIENQPASMRVVQVEELTDHFVPTATGYRLYRKDHQNPDITANCDFSGGKVVCTGNSGKDQAARSAPYKLSGPFWMWVEGLFSLDMPWLLGGAANMAHLEKGRASVATLTVSGGSGVMIGDAVSAAILEAMKTPSQTLVVVAPDKPIPWSFTSEPESSLQFVDAESIDLSGTKVATKHYACITKGDEGGLWITDSGLLVKLVLGGASYSLADYKQYRKIIPELQVEKVTR
jgi:hypothetical protein